MLREEEIIFIQQFRSLETTNKVKLVKQTKNPLLIARFRRFVFRHKFDNRPNVTTSEGF